MRETDTHIYFYKGFLSNFVPKDLSIHFDHNIFTNSEQIFMYLKARYFKDQESADKIVSEGKEPRIARNLGQLVKNYSDKEWFKVREGMMFKACYLKFNSNEELKNKLLNTGNKTLVEASPTDQYWGVRLVETDDRILDEKNWKGQNLLGKVLVKVRDKLKLEQI